MWNDFLGAAAVPMEANDHDARIRAYQAIVELSALLDAGGIKRSVVAHDKDSVVAWSTAVKHPVKAMLALPVLCPPYSDPTSIMIVDPSSLEYELEDSDDIISASWKNETHKPGKAKVRFQTTVTVVTIPSHRDMDRSVLESCWTSLDEIQRNAKRNAQEYKYDGREWRTVREEQDMIYDLKSGEYMHPATWARLQGRMQHKHQLAALERVVLEEWRRLAAMEQHYRQKRALLKKRMEADRRKWHEGAASEQAPAWYVV
jgi:hypothetical protein